jgi:hypothetical protein
MLAATSCTFVLASLALSRSGTVASFTPAAEES